MRMKRGLGDGSLAPEGGGGVWQEDCRPPGENTYMALVMVSGVCCLG